MDNSMDLSDEEFLNLVDFNKSLTKAIGEFYERKNTKTLAPPAANADEREAIGHGDKDEDGYDIPGRSDQSINQSQVSDSRENFSSTSEDFSQFTGLTSGTTLSQSSDAGVPNCESICFKNGRKSVTYDIVFDNPRLTREVQLVGNLKSIRIQTKSTDTNQQISSNDAQLEEKVKKLEATNKELEKEIKKLKIKLDQANETIGRLELENLRASNCLEVSFQSQKK